MQYGGMLHARLVSVHARKHTPAPMHPQPRTRTHQRAQAHTHTHKIFCLFNGDCFVNAPHYYVTRTLAVSLKLRRSVFCAVRSRDLKSSKRLRFVCLSVLFYKVVQIWQTVTCLLTNSPGHIWTTLYFHRLQGTLLKTESAQLSVGIRSSGCSVVKI